MIPDTDARMLALYEDAIDRLPPLSRIVFLLHRVDDLAYTEIAGRLSITVAVVEACMIEALSVICATVDRRPYRPRPRALIAEAEAVLRERHRHSRAQRSRTNGVASWRTLRIFRPAAHAPPTFEQWLRALSGAGGHPE
ncbi:hypothetical protein D0Z70_07450 [Sphingobium terrigena]|uniref:RNA polymerase sigma factor 70 region 4 type 2 domain-containing protein n=1 Tax=Sphingobium terrigena TaxID=2304063 RepID=A0A418YUL0_9SPHN|nr:sigma factor-like helix-turn-helix DNA-binding protein [Sphingobium terrigena]RJG55863.1 hypothetical protein D0Z70_07450 [Sphingobium terrigena]